MKFKTTLIALVAALALTACDPQTSRGTPAPAPTTVEIDIDGPTKHHCRKFPNDPSCRRVGAPHAASQPARSTPKPSYSYRPSSGGFRGGFRGGRR